MAAIEILGLEKTYSTGFLRKRPKTALRPLNLQVEQGEVFGFLGPNGAGKTTTLKLLMGLIAPTAGTARILARDWRDPAVKKRIGFLPEQPYFYDHLTPSELLDYFGTLSGMPPAERRARIPAVLESVGLAPHANVQLRKFSKGMQQRVGIAQAVLHNPDIVFLDEPMSGLDPLGRREVREFIRTLNREGKTVFFSTHILSDAETLCHRVSVLNHGELRGVGVVSDLVSRSRSRFEVVWKGSAALPEVKALGVHSHHAGEVITATVNAADLDRLLELLRSRGQLLVSVNPAGGSLEEFFLEKVEAAKEAVR
jgi:ABC-2 type transport system ATP-binding protein